MDIHPCQELHDQGYHHCEICYKNSKFYSIVRNNKANFHELVSQRIEVLIKKRCLEIMNIYVLLPSVLIQMVVEFVCQDEELWYVWCSPFNLMQKKNVHQKECLWFVPSQSPINRIFQVDLPSTIYTWISQKLQGYDDYIFHLFQWVKTTDNQSVVRLWKNNLSYVPHKWILLAEIPKPQKCRLREGKFDFKLNNCENILSICDDKGKHWFSKKKLKFRKSEKFANFGNLQESLEIFTPHPIITQYNDFGKEKNEKYHLDLKYNNNYQLDCELSCMSEICGDKTTCPILFPYIKRCKDIASQLWTFTAKCPQTK